jgi:hypothetical protein
MDGRMDGLRPPFGALKKRASLQLYLFPPPAAEDASPERASLQLYLFPPLAAEDDSPETSVFIVFLSCAAFFF